MDTWDRLVETTRLGDPYGPSKGAANQSAGSGDL